MDNLIVLQPVIISNPSFCLLFTFHSSCPLMEIRVFNFFSAFCQHYLGLLSVSPFPPTAYLFPKCAVFSLQSFPAVLPLLSSFPPPFPSRQQPEPGTPVSPHSLLSWLLCSGVQAAGGRLSSRPPPVCYIFYFTFSAVNSAWVSVLSFPSQHNVGLTSFASVSLLPAAT